MWNVSYNLLLADRRIELTSLTLSERSLVLLELGRLSITEADWGIWRRLRVIDFQTKDVSSIFQGFPVLCIK